MTFHVNPATGNASRCRATILPCPFGGDSGTENHYSSIEEARKAYEQIAGQKKTINLKRKTPKHGESITETAERIQETMAYRMSELSSLSSFEVAERVRYAEKVLDGLVKSGHTTEKMYAQEHPKFGIVFTPDRAEQHQEIIDDIVYRVNKKNVPQDGKVIIAGGLGGAGKSTVMDNYAGINRDDYVTINPDDIKEVMAEKGMIPSVKGLTPMEASPLVHEEASHITKILMDKFSREKRNVILDVTMSSLPSVEHKTEMFKSRGYSSVKAIFVDIEPTTSLKRARLRHHRGLDSYVTKGQGYGGRILPEKLVKQQAPDDPSKFKSSNAETLVKAHRAGLFTEPPMIYDNNTEGEAPKKVDYDDFTGDYDSLLMGLMSDD